MYDNLYVRVKYHPTLIFRGIMSLLRFLREGRVAIPVRCSRGSPTNVFTYPRPREGFGEMRVRLHEWIEKQTGKDGLEYIKEAFLKYARENRIRIEMKEPLVSTEGVPVAIVMPNSEWYYILSIDFGNNKLVLKNERENRTFSVDVPERFEGQKIKEIGVRWETIIKTIAIVFLHYRDDVSPPPHDEGGKVLFRIIQEVSSDYVPVFRHISFDEAVQIRVRPRKDIVPLDRTYVDISRKDSIYVELKLDDMGLFGISRRSRRAKRFLTRIRVFYNPVRKKYALLEFGLEPHVIGDAWNGDAELLVDGGLYVKLYDGAWYVDYDGKSGNEVKGLDKVIPVSISADIYELYRQVVSTT